MEADLRSALAADDPGDLVAFSALIELLADIEYRQEDAQLGMALTVDSLTFDFPFEADVRRDEFGRVTLDAAPPTQELETSTMPVFHRLKVRIARDAHD